MIEIIIPLCSLVIVLFYGELAIHKYMLRRLALKDGDQEAAALVTNEGLMAAGIAGAGAWLLLAIEAGDGGDIMQIVIVALLVLGVIGAVWLYARMRFGE